LTDEKDSISNDLLGCFYESPNIDNLKIWLQLLVSKKIYNDYYFSVPNNPLIYSNEIVPLIHKTLNGTKNENVISELLRALQGRYDDTTTNLLIKYLKHKNSSIRYWSAITLEGNKSDKLKLLLPILAKDKNFRTSGIVKLLIENDINNLQSLFKRIYLKSNKNLEWERNSIEYLSCFPLKNHIKIFRKILVNNESDFSLKYNAAIGLGKLNDTNSVDLIINICETERKNSDYNVRIYLEVLGKLKGKKAKREIETFLTSDEPIIRELSKSLIENWDKK
jgi:HEAT repeat protein